MAFGLRQKLYEAVKSFPGSGRQEYFGRKDSLSSPHHFTRRASTIIEDETVHGWERNSFSGRPGLCRKFLLRLAVALHSYGSSSSRTEYLVEKVADKLKMETNIAVFPSLILISFTDTEDSARNEIHLITVETDLDVDKLARADELANHIGKQELSLLSAYWRLKTIATSPAHFGIWWRIFSYALSASMAAPLFYDGNIWDALFCFPLGLGVGILDMLASKSSLFANVLEFAAALFVSFLAKLFAIYLVDLKLCFSSMALSSLVQLLPGMALTLGVSEMVAKTYVTGTSHIMYALFSALQLGFGLSVGEKLVWWVKTEPSAPPCPASKLSVWWNVIWFSGFTAASNMLLNARFNQWPGMTLASGVGFLVSTLASLQFDSNISSVIAAFSVGITGTICSLATGDLPLVMVLSGILQLVPGGVGVKGVSAMLESDIPTGMTFVFDMAVVGLSITIGLLISKIVIPAALFGTSKYVAHNKSTLAAQFLEEPPHLEEDMAF
ncbi:hypothetical protein O6H91_11G088800 [Diphasiastrum complanatum]|nr:hypothetical protein O6H91_11G088800 [Diphasiastrum complanatum]